MDYNTIIEELKAYYANLLIVQYNDKPKAKATIKTFTNMMFANAILLQIQNSFDIKTAVGEQLDIIGKWVGISRTYNGSLYWGRTFFSYPSWNSLTPDDTTDNLQHGYSDYETFNDDVGSTLSYGSLGYIEQRLDDEDYRLVIGLKIIKNNINHTCKGIDDAIWQYFNGQVYTTWEPHVITYHYPASLTTVMEVCNYKDVLPAPTGVSVVLREI